MVNCGFHEHVANWFVSNLGEPTAIQRQAWPSIQKQRHTLISAPTGSGKTLAAFLAIIDSMVKQGISGQLEDTTTVVYVSPLKALSNDISFSYDYKLGNDHHFQIDKA